MENVTGSIKISDHLTIEPLRIIYGEQAKHVFDKIMVEHLEPRKKYDDDNLLVCGLMKEYDVYAKKHTWTAFDNRSGDCWTESFGTRAAALKWIFDGD